MNFRIPAKKMEYDGKVSGCLAHDGGLYSMDSAKATGRDFS